MNNITPLDIEQDIKQNIKQAECNPLLESAKLDITKKLNPPPKVMKINGETFGTLGNFSLAIGKAKSKKTFLMALLMAAAVKNDNIENAFKGLLPTNKNRVVFVDTEQSEYYVQLVAKRVLKSAGIREADNFDVYGLRPYNTDERNQIIEEIIDSTPDLGLLIIDGVRDVVTSINDEEEATKWANKLLKWTEERQIHITTVLHQNKGDFNARGHLGTELVNKAELTLSAKVDPRDAEKSIISPEYCRHKAFEPFAIWIDDNEQYGLPKKAEGWKPKDENKSKNAKDDPHEVSSMTHRKILRKIKKNVQGEKPNYSEMIEQINLVVSNLHQSIGNTKARNYLTFYKNEGFVTRNGKKRSSKSYYKINLTPE